VSRALGHQFQDMMDGRFEFISKGHFFYFLSTHPTTSHLHRIALHPFHANDLRSNKPPICTFHVILSTGFTTTRTLTSLLYLYHSRPTSEHDYDATIVISALRIWHSDTPNISWLRLFERVVHCPLILDFSCIYTGSTVNGELHASGRTPHDHRCWPAD
jgi:hypothetical protein